MFQSITILILLIVAIAFVVWLGFYMPNIKGKMGEFNVATILSTLSRNDYHIFNNIIVPSKYGTTQIDHVVVSIYGIFVIETKNYKGLIYGGDNAETWTKNMWGNKYSFRNPLKQNYGHVKSLQAIIDVSQNVFVPIVVFSNRANISVNTNEWVINLCHLRKVIKKYQTPIFSQDQITDFCTKINAAKIEAKGASKQHVETVRSNIFQKNQAIANGICPRCGGRLVYRNGRYGPFYGCNNYPSCKFTLEARNS